MTTSDASTLRTSFSGFPSMDDMITLYKKVLSELDEVLSEVDIAIAIQKQCPSCNQTTTARHAKESAIATERFN